MDILFNKLIVFILLLIASTKVEQASVILTLTKKGYKRYGHIEDIAVFVFFLAVALLYFDLFI